MVEKSYPKVRPSRIVPVELDGDYEGWKVWIRLPVPLGPLGDVFTAIDQASEEGAEPGKQFLVTRKTIGFLQDIATDWNFIDYEGQPLPLDDEGWRQVDLDLLTTLMRKVNEVVAQAPLAGETQSES